MQTTSHLLMIRPWKFDFNAETAVNNAFQEKDASNDIASRAAKEFEDFAQLLTSHGINVHVVDDTETPRTPDSIFPNNWVSFHSDGKLVLYPMFAKNRRAERKPGVLNHIREAFVVSEVLDLTPAEDRSQFLEGTGSMVLDRENRLAFACLSPRTDLAVLKEFCQRMNYRPVVFHAVDNNDQPIYHSNVMMCVGEQFVVICLEAIKDPTEQAEVVQTIANTGRKLISISLNQMNHFAGNMLQVRNGEGQRFLVMSTQARESLTPLQVQELSAFGPLLHSPLYSIEKNGGGSARCMLAEVFLPLVKKTG